MPYSVYREWSLALLNNGDVVDVVGGNRSEGSGSDVISIM